MLHDMSDFPDRRVCVLGLGYVGLTLATVMASVGFEIDGVEVRPDVVEALRQGRAHFSEPGLDERLGKLVAAGRLRVLEAIPQDSRATVYIITVGTPLGADGKVRLDMMERVAQQIAGRLKAGDMVIMRSTVRLGVTRQVVVPILDRVGVPYHIAVCPERTVEGQALSELRWLPQIVGSFSMEARLRAARLFNFLTPTVVQVPQLEVAEMVKLIDNTYRDVSFAFANEVALMCEAAGINAMDVISAGKLGYPRTNLPLPGPVGGPCLEKDPHILAESLSAFAMRPNIVVAARDLNERLPAMAVARMRTLAAGMPGFPEQPVIALLGLAFKGRPATDDLRGTMAKPILAELRAAFPGARIRGFDAVVSAEAVREFFDIEPAPSIATAMRGAHLVVIANNHPCFEAMALESLAEDLARPGLIYDFWNTFDAREKLLPDGVRYLALGGV